MPTPSPVKGGKLPKARKLTCKSCNGSGRIDDHELPVRRCDDCAGLGYYHKKVARRIPKARVAYQDADSATFVHPERIDRDSISCAVVCCATKAQAARICKMANASGAERIDRLQWVFWNKTARTLSYADAIEILNYFGLGGRATR